MIGITNEYRFLIIIYYTTLGQDYNLDEELSNDNCLEYISLKNSNDIFAFNLD